MVDRQARHAGYDSGKCVFGIILEGCRFRGIAPDVEIFAVAKHCDHFVVARYAQNLLSALR